MPTGAAIVHVIDDEEAIRDSLRFVLESEGFLVHTFTSASDFLTWVSPDVHGCIVTDIRMPGMSGIELIRRLKLMDVAAPVIAITGHADARLIAETIASGAIKCVMKPFKDDDLLSTIRAALFGSATAA